MDVMSVIFISIVVVLASFVPMFLMFILMIKLQNWTFRRFWRAKRQVENESPEHDKDYLNR